jgi:hypothetical protein
VSKTEEKIQTINSRLAVGNVFALLWILIGTTACWIVTPLAGWIFLAFSAISVYIIMRALVCPNACYYCQSCTKGFMKLSIIFLGASSIPGSSRKLITGMMVFVYIVLLIIPGGLLASSLVNSFSYAKIAVLLALFAFSATALIARIRKRNRTLGRS